MADKDKKVDVSKPAEGPKPVHIGGESLIDRLLPHIKKILVGTVALAVILMGAFGYRACKRDKQEKQTAKLAAVFEADQPLADPSTPPDPVKNPGFANSKQRAEQLLAELAKQDTSAVTPAMKAALLVDAGKYDEAIAEYQKCQKGNSIDAVLCREGLAIALESKAAAEQDPAARQQGLEKALEAFASMQPIEDGPRRVFALYHQGRIQLLLGKRAEGKALLEKAKELSPPEDLRAAIERRLAMLGAT